MLVAVIEETCEVLTDFVFLDDSKQSQIRNCSSPAIVATFWPHGDATIQRIQAS